MAITTQAGYVAAPKQLIEWQTVNRATNGAFTDVTADASAGNTANGVIPTNDGVLYPKIQSFPAGATGYLTRLEYRSVYVYLQHAILFDCLFKAGAYSFGANTALTSQPSLTRVPNSDYKGLELWVQISTAFTGTCTVTITYLNENGTQHSTDATTVGNATNDGTLLQIPLANGDEGIQQIVSVVESGGGSAGTFNVQIMRRLGVSTLANTNTSAYFDKPQDFLMTGMPVVYDTSALCWAHMSSSSSRAWYHTIEIAMG